MRKPSMCCALFKTCSTSRCRFVQDFVLYPQTINVKQGYKSREDRILIIHSDSVWPMLSTCSPSDCMLSLAPDIMAIERAGH